MKITNQTTTTTTTGLTADWAVEKRAIKLCCEYVRIEVAIIPSFFLRFNKIYRVTIRPSLYNNNNMYTPRVAYTQYKDTDI